MKAVVSVKKVFGFDFLNITMQKKVHPYQQHFEQCLADLTHSVIILLSQPTPTWSQWAPSHQHCPALTRKLQGSYQPYLNLFHSQRNKKTKFMFKTVLTQQDLSSQRQYYHKSKQTDGFYSKYTNLSEAFIIHFQIQCIVSPVIYPRNTGRAWDVWESPALFNPPQFISVYKGFMISSVSPLQSLLQYSWKCVLIDRYFFFFF